MKKILAIVLALVMVFAFAACGEKKEETPKVDPNAKSEGTMTYEQYMAAAMDSDVVIEGFITAKMYAKAWGNVGLILQDGDGAYYVYRMPCDDALDAKLEVGKKVKITGIKTEWSGEVELKEGSSTCEVLDESYTFAAKDITALIGTDDLIKDQNKAVSVKEATVSAAPLYKWDGSGSEGDDIYVGLTINGTEYSFMVESDLCGTGTDAYEAAKALQVGDKIAIEGFLYWYNGPQVWMTKITK